MEIATGEMHMHLQTSVHNKYEYFYLVSRGGLINLKWKILFSEICAQICTYLESPLVGSWFGVNLIIPWAGLDKAWGKNLKLGSGRPAQNM